MRRKLLSILLSLKADMFFYLSTVLMKSSQLSALYAFIEDTHAGEQIRDAWISVVHTYIPSHSRSYILMPSFLWTYDLHLAHLAWTDFLRRSLLSILVSTILIDLSHMVEVLVFGVGVSVLELVCYELVDMVGLDWSGVGITADNCFMNDMWWLLHLLSYKNFS